MKLSQFQFNLTKDKIASEPPRWRDECKLMVLHKDSGEIEHRLFKNIIDYFGKGDTTGSYSTTPRYFRPGSTGTRKRQVPISKSSC